MKNIKSTKNGGGYDFYSRTSFATPFVSGVAAMMLSFEHETYDGYLTALDLKGIIMDTAVYNPNLEGYCVTEGVIDAHAAVIAALEYVPTYSYEYYNPTHHVKTRTYGDEYLEEHLYVPVNTGGILSSYALPSIQIFECAMCGARRNGL